MAGTGQDQHLKLHSQIHSILQVFFTRNTVSPQANICGENSVSPLRHSFFFFPVPQQKEGRLTVGHESNFRKDLSLLQNLSILDKHFEFQEKLVCY